MTDPINNAPPVPTRPAPSNIEEKRAKYNSLKATKMNGWLDKAKSAVTSLKMPKGPELSRKQKIVIITSIALLALAGLGTLAIWKTVGFHAAGEGLKNAAYTTWHALSYAAHRGVAGAREAASQLTYGEVSLIGLGGVGLGIFGTLAVRAIKHRMDARKELKREEAMKEDNTKDLNPNDFTEL